MTAQTTTRPTAAGVRIAPMLVVIIAILAFGAGLAVAQVAAPAATTPAAPAPAAPERGGPTAPDVTRGFVPSTSQEYTTLSGWTDAATSDDGLARPAGRHR